MADEKKWKEAEAHWRKEHAKQSYADKDLSYGHYAPAYQIGHEAALKHPGRRFEELEDDLALDYERARPDSALPWDQARPAVKAAWDRLGGVIGPRDTERGIRSGF
jgi:hypothetical protein